MVEYCAARQVFGGEGKPMVNLVSHLRVYGCLIGFFTLIRIELEQRLNTGKLLGCQWCVWLPRVISDQTSCQLFVSVCVYKLQ